MHLTLAKLPFWYRRKVRLAVRSRNFALIARPPEARLLLQRKFCGHQGLDGCTHQVDASYKFILLPAWSTLERAAPTAGSFSRTCNQSAGCELRLSRVLAVMELALQSQCPH
jgi:hypothetical protein